ncbi:hypothetical protein [Streptomyces sp. NPDC018610]|uniref:hypothetical protein n=1 Tax=Streptomyces sp. NPDC018610 TaxID=3365049 RepID=UPI0037B58F51
MKTTTRYAAVAAALACCCLPLTACGAEHAGVRPAATSASAEPAAGSADETSDDQGADLPDTTSDDQGDLPDTTSDDQGDLPDTTTDDQNTDLPDTTSDDPGADLPDTTSDDQQDTDDPYADEGTTDGSVPATGPHRWFPMLHEFRAYLTTSARKADAAIAAHVTSVETRTPAGGARSVAVVRVDYGVGEQDEADRTAEVFARWRLSVYGDHGHVDVLGPAKTTAERDW